MGMIWQTLGPMNDWYDYDDEPEPPERTRDSKIDDADGVLMAELFNANPREVCFISVRSR